MIESARNSDVIDVFLSKEDRYQDRHVGTVRICERVQDIAYRRKLCHTACTTWAMVSFGVVQTMISLALPEIMVLVDKDLDDASWIFTTWSFGSMLGSLIAGYTYDRLNKLAVLVSLSVGLTITTGTTPWCTYYPAMLLVHLIGGGFASAVHSTVTADTIFLWNREKATYLQIVHLASTAGGILGPAFVNPFLGSVHSQIELDKNSTTIDTADVPANLSQHRTFDNNISIAIRNSSKASAQVGTEIQYAYFLVCGFTFIGVILYALNFIVHGNIYMVSCDQKNVDDLGQADNKTFSKKCTLIFIFIVAFQVMVYITLQRHMYGLFMTFAIKNLEMSKTYTTNILAGFWCIFCVGRIVAIFLIRFVKEDRLNWCYLFVTFLGMIGFSVASYLKVSVIVVICFLLSGFGMAPLFTFNLSWFSSYITLITGRIMGVVYVFMAIGGMTVPVISGYLMDNISYDWYLIILIILLLMFTLVTIILRILYRKIK